MPTQIFVNMQVNDLANSMTFFKKLGWSFNMQFTNDDAACLVISNTIYCMLHTSSSIQRFLPKGKTVGDATKSTEVLLAFSVESREAVDVLYNKALAGGATECRPAEDHGFMFARSFNDLDGHIWEVFWMDQKQAQG
ncbi:MAG: glyoxalase/bleomycin resistance/extradiol dioxygenase family protein [Flavobacteriales bacterium]|nr:glyoxalase/bleomycin resistance/extradiol dioxygenase family protein [Flavobacteriales bacterium]